MPADNRGLPTINVAEFLYGEAGVELNDPAELFHEASKLYPSALGRQAAGTWLLEFDEDIQVTLARAIKRYIHVPVIQLPPCVLPAASFEAVMRGRRSRREFGKDPIPLVSLANVLYATYGVIHETQTSGFPTFAFRTVPSGGALYPLELYVLVRNVGGVHPGLYHYDPARHLLEDLRPRVGTEPLEECLVQPEILRDAGAVIMMTALFWRSRIKYGLRGYRFALIEAGHCAQNALLAGEALGLAMVPVGGFIDCKVERLLDVDGVNESPVYLIALGTRAVDRPCP